MRAGSELTCGIVTGQTLREVVQFWASETPESPALLASGRTPLNYADFLRLIDETGSALQSMGLAYDARVAMVLPDGPEAAAAFCAIAGAAACAPLNPAYTARDFEFYLTDLRAAAVVVDDRFPSPVAEVAVRLGIAVVRLAPHGDVAGRFLLRGTSERIREPKAGCRPAPDDVALFLHTSGTTSRPKLVPLTQRNLCASARNIVASLRLGPDDRCLSIMPLFHIHGLMATVIAPLFAGASVVCTPGFHAARFFAWLEEFHPTWYSAVPAMHNAILSYAEASGRRARARLRFIRSSSASLPPVTMERLETLFEAPVIESYGMTEASHQMASNPLPPAPRKPGSVGLAAGPEIAIIDESGAVLRAGQAGEVAIRGDNVTSGYEQAGGADRAVFTDEWFRTGDQGYFDADGYLFLTGRLKEIINRGGEKISPREIEEALLRHPSVLHAVAFAVPDQRLGEVPGAAVTLHEGRAADPRSLREFVAGHLPAFKVPAIIQVVAEIPTGPTGKPKRIGMAAMLGLDTIDTIGAIDAPEVGTEQVVEDRIASLRTVWCELLGLRELGADEDFFALGGTSLQVAELAVRLETRTGHRFDLLDFAARPTLRGLASILGHRARSVPVGLIPIQSGGAGPVLLCIPTHLAYLRDFVELARLMGPGHTVFGVDLAAIVHQVGLEFCAVAERIATLWNGYQPEGPLLLLGHCVGGRLAYDVACRLSDLGRDVAYTGLIHAYNERYERTLTKRERRAWQARNAVGWVGYYWSKICLGRDPYHGESRLAIHLDWRPRPYSGRVVLYRNRLPRRPGRDSALMGWDGLVASDTPVLRMTQQYRNFSGVNIRFVAESARSYLQAAKEAIPVTGKTTPATLSI